MASTLALRSHPSPLAFVDLDALEHNIRYVLEHSRDKPIRVATKSIRSIDLVRFILAKAPDRFRGLMAYSAAEACFLFEQGLNDILVAYPSVDPAQLSDVARAVSRGADISLVVDEAAHLDLVEAAARQHDVRLGVVVDVDVSLRVAGAHVGVRRSPLHAREAVVEFARQIQDRTSLKLVGLMGYEAHVAGLSDRRSGSRMNDAARAAFKRVANPSVASQRRAILESMATHGFAVGVFNGGGSGSLASSASDPSLTEITVGSAFLAGHLFDRFSEIETRPAAYFALPVTRVPAPGYVTCQSGGFIASGAPGPDRLPMPVSPPGLKYLSMEGAGEVQTPLRVPEGVDLRVGDPVLFRHAKSGELAEHFDRYFLVRGDGLEGEAATYRGMGKCFY